MIQEKDVVIWGTGAILEKYYKLLEEFNILYFIDKDKKKQGKKLKGIEIKAPCELKHEECSYIIIMTDYYKEVLKNGQEFNIPKEKFVPYVYIGNISKYPVRTNRGNVFLSQWSKCHEKKIMLISHNFSRTGAPIALLYLAYGLKKQGYSVLFASMSGGELVKELEANDIDYINDISFYYQCDEFLRRTLEFEFVIVNTITLGKVVSEIANHTVPIVWWIHESEDKYYVNLNINVHKNVYFFGVGKRVINCFKKYYPQVQMRELLYPIPDFFANGTKYKKGEKISIAIIGLIHYCKGLDVLIDALNQLDEKKLYLVKLLIVGKLEDCNQLYWLNIEKKIPKSLEYHLLGELNCKQLQDIYARIDLLVAPSRADSMPMVVTEAMMNCVTCIISDNVGQKTFIHQGQNGFVFNDTCELRDLIEWSIYNREKIEMIGKKSREIYMENFLPDKICKKMSKILLDIRKKESNF